MSSDPHHKMVLVSRSTLDSLTEGIAASLSKMKDLEDQVKVIPSLQRTVDMMLQSSCSNGFCTTNSQRSTPSTTSFESSSNQLINNTSTQSRLSSNNSTSNYCATTDARANSPGQVTKIDFDDLINDLISLSYSVNYISSSSSSNSSNTISITEQPSKQFINPHSLPSSAKHEHHHRHHHFADHHSYPNKNYTKSNNKPATSLHSMDYQSDANRMSDTAAAKNHDSCPPFFRPPTATPTSCNLPPNISTNKMKQDAAVNTDLFMEDIITRGELNEYIKKQYMYKQDSVKAPKTLASQVSHDIAVDCNMGSSPFREPALSTTTTTSSSNFTLGSQSNKQQSTDTGYDTFERCEVATQVDKNIWGFMNYLSHEDQTPKEPSTPNEHHVTTILINQNQLDEPNTALVELPSETRDLIKRPVYKLPNNENGKSRDCQREKVKIKVELPRTSGSHFKLSRAGKTSIPISISSLSSSSTSAISNPLTSGQLFSELTTSSEDEDDDSSVTSRHDSGKSPDSTSDEQTSVSEEEDDDEEDEEGDDDLRDDVSSLGSYQDPSDFEEYCAFGLTALDRDHMSCVKLVSGTGANSSMRSQPSKEFREAIHYLADHLKEDDDLSKIQEMTSYFEVIRREWFGVATRKDSCYQSARIYLELFESLSKQLLNTVVNLTDIAGNSVLHYAASHFNYQLLNVLLDTKVCDMNRRNKAGYTPIMLLALADIGDHFKEMVARRVFQLGNVNIKATQNGQTALMLAASHGRKKTCKLLLECGADPSLQDNDGSTALMCGSEIGHIEIVKSLLAHRLTDPNATDNDGLDALAIAMQNGHRDVGLVLYAAKNMLRTRGGSSGVGASLRRTSSKSSTLYPVRRSDSLASSRNRQQTNGKFDLK